MTVKRPRHLVLIILLIIAILAGMVTLLIHSYRQYLLTAYPLEYEELIEKYSQEYGIAPSLIAAIICTESHFRPEAVSSAGAVGLMQLTPETFHWAQRRAGIKDRQDQTALTDPETSIRFGTYTLLLLYQQFEHHDTALAAYNAGQGRVHGWLKDPTHSADGVTLQHIPYKETEQYVKRVKKAQTIYRTLYNLD